MIELNSEDIKNAVSARLFKVAPECGVYKEAVRIPKYPHIFVHLVSVNDREDRRGRHILSYSFDLRYRVASDSSTDGKLEQDLDAMALNLMASFNIIECDDGTKVRCEDKSYEKVDGVLHFFFKVDVQTILKDLDMADPVKQGKLDIEMELKHR